MSKLIWSMTALAVTVTSLKHTLPRADAADAAGAAAPRTTIVWGACPAAPAGLEVDPKQTCGTLSVPLDYRHPHGRQLTIAVSRIPATDPAKRRGVLLLNPGGPGAEGLDLPSAFDHAAVNSGAANSGALLAAYDRIGFDPRGVGHSSPVTCGLSTAEIPLPVSYPAPDGSIDDTVASARSVAVRCAARSGDVLPFITTANTARDMDRIRQALGEQRISYFGGSYGTYLGAVFATLYPQRTDRMVLDSAADPTLVWREFFRQQREGITIRFPDAARYAADHADEITFGSTPAAVTRHYFTLAAHLDRHPARVPNASIVLSGNMFRLLTFSLLYSNDNGLVAKFWRAATDLSAGHATPADMTVLQPVLATAVPGAASSPGVPPDNQIAAQYAVTCDDVSWPRNVHTYARQVAEDRRHFPLSAGFASNVSPCTFWHSTPTERAVTISEHGPRTIMILQNERDPATPMKSGRGMHQALGQRSRLITVDQGGHGVYSTQPCATTTANAFLITGTMPDHDLVCAPS